MRPPSTRGAGESAHPERFEDIEWEEVTGTDRRVSRRVRGFLLGLGLVVAGFLYDQVAGRSLPLVANLEPLDWLFAGSLLAVGTFVVAPVVASGDERARYWNRLRSHPAGLPSLVVVLAFFAVGLLAPVLASEPTTVAFERSFQPPVGLTVDTAYLFTEDACVGPIVDGRCHGTLRYPLGTTQDGHDLLPFVLLGTRTALVVAVVSATIVVPAGVAVGLLAAYASGRTDRTLMQVAEVAQTLPAVIIYMLFWGWNAEYRLLVLIGVFGLTGWGGLARLVRNEALQLRERPYVKAARDAGAGRIAIMRRHLLPNISRSVLANVTLQVPLFIVIEAGLSFIVLASPFDGDPVTLGDPTVVSWGQTMYMGTNEAGVEPGWWVAAVPGVALVATMLAFALLGRTLGHALDPTADN